MREIDSDCCSISKPIVSSPLPEGAHRFVVEFNKQNIFTYPFPSKFIGICRQKGNLLSKQSVVRCDICLLNGSWIEFLNFNVTMMGHWYLIRSGINGELTRLYTTFSGSLTIFTIARSRREEEFSV